MDINDVFYYILFSIQQLRIYLQMNIVKKECYRKLSIYINLRGDIPLS